MSDALQLLISLLAVAGIWVWSVRGRERVLAISSEICRDLKVQRLDDSVALRGLRIRWNDGIALERRYNFEFSTDGADRCQGEISLSGLDLVWARLAHPSGAILIDIATHTVQ